MKTYEQFIEGSMQSYIDNLKFENVEKSEKLEEKLSLFKETGLADYEIKLTAPTGYLKDGLTLHPVSGIIEVKKAYSGKLKDAVETVENEFVEMFNEKKSIYRWSGVVSGGEITYEIKLADTGQEVPRCYFNQFINNNLHSSLERKVERRAIQKKKR